MNIGRYLNSKLCQALTILLLIERERSFRHFFGIFVCSRYSWNLFMSVPILDESGMIFAVRIFILHQTVIDWFWHSKISISSTVNEIYFQYLFWLVVSNNSYAARFYSCFFHLHQTDIIPTLSQIYLFLLQWHHNTH